MLLFNFSQGPDVWDYIMYFLHTCDFTKPKNVYV